MASGFGVLVGALLVTGFGFGTVTNAGFGLCEESGLLSWRGLTTGVGVVFGASLAVTGAIGLGAGSRFGLGGTGVDGELFCCVVVVGDGAGKGRDG